VGTDENKWMDHLPWGLAMNHHLPSHGALLCIKVDG
jgi:hypothetical protein